MKEPPLSPHAWLEGMKNWGWILFLVGGQIKVYEPGKHVKTMDMYNANVILMWTWDHEDMWVKKNRYGDQGCWLSETTIVEPPPDESECQSDVLKYV